ncbi:hypothetical protein ACTD5D_23300 [Nocardia takedensis]
MPTPARTYAIIIAQVADDLANMIAERDALLDASTVTRLPRTTASGR